MVFNFPHIPHVMSTHACILYSLRDPEQGLRKLLPYDQLTMRGEDLTGLMFARFPKVGRGQGEGQTEESSLLEGENDGSEGGSGKVTPTGRQEGYK